MQWCTPVLSLRIAGAQKDSEETVESRTVLVTNILRLGGAATEASAPTQLVGTNSLNTPSKSHYMRTTLVEKRTWYPNIHAPASVGVSSSAHHS
ncbi:uncharacterized protein LOC126784391 isoform X2 [Argentina anserina]|uniref:uncharacterized protein LOC126784391 isoform X2 n=1 Tax=Argentina anserina TaxID=57926 RepID=UPI00217663F5|nr:uncharacterized protein LOC126784391 isoform X2 [Potentilla anserina]